MQSYTYMYLLRSGCEYEVRTPPDDIAFCTSGRDVWGERGEEGTMGGDCEE